MENLRDKLLELVYAAHNAVTDKAIENHSTFGMSYSEQIETETDHLIANGVTVQRWIPVTERLPTYGQEVIVYGGNYLKACITAMRFWDEAHVNWYGVTHWMPLPEAPKEVD